MVDNTTLNTGSGGDTIATDDIGGVKHQRVKVQFGVDGSATDVSDSDPLPIDDAGGSLTVDGTITADAGTGPWPVTDNGGSLTVDGTVTADAGTGPWPVTDNGGSLTVDNGGTFATQVDGDALTSLQLIDNIVSVEDAVHGSGDSGVMALAVRNDTLAALAGADGDYAPLQVNADGALVTKEAPNVVDSNNSTTTPLGISATFTGTGTDILGYSGVTIQIFADQDGAAAGMRFEFSTDNTNWDVSHQHDYAANTGRMFQFSGHSQYFRVVFVNGTTGQGAFRLQTILHKTSPNRSIHRLDDSLAPDRSANVIKASLMAQAAGSGNFIPIDSTAGGNLKVAVEEFDSSLPAGTNNIGDVDVLSIVPGTGSTNLGKAEDAAHTSGDVGVMALGVRRLADTPHSGTDGDYEPLQMDANGRLKVEIFDGGDDHTINGSVTLNANSGVDIGDVDVTSISAGSNLVGDVGLSGARTSGGTTLFKSIDLDESEEEIKDSAGQVYWIAAFNLSAATKFLKFYNATAASVTVGTTVPDLTFPLPTQGDTNGAGFILSVPNGIAFGTAITVAATTGVADNDSGAPGANEIVVAIGYA